MRTWQINSQNSPCHLRSHHPSTDLRTLNASLISEPELKAKMSHFRLRAYVLQSLHGPWDLRELKLERKSPRAGCRATAGLSRAAGAETSGSSDSSARRKLTKVTRNFYSTKFPFGSHPALLGCETQTPDATSHLGHSGSRSCRLWSFPCPVLSLISKLAWKSTNLFVRSPARWSVCMWWSSSCRLLLLLQLRSGDQPTLYKSNTLW